MCEANAVLCYILALFLFDCFWFFEIGFLWIALTALELIL